MCQIFFLCTGDIMTNKTVHDFKEFTFWWKDKDTKITKLKKKSKITLGTN